MQGRWARDWVGWQGFGRFSSQLLDALVQPTIAQGYEASASVAGTSLVVEVRAEDGSQTTSRPAGRLLGPDNAVIDVPLVEREPGVFRGSVPLPAAGVYRVQVTTTSASGDPQLLASAGAVVPASAEYLQREGNPGLLRAIAERTGGRVDFPASDAFVRPAVAARTVAPATWPLLWLAVLLWPLDIAIRRLLLPSMIPAALRQRVRRTSVEQPSPRGAALRRAETLLHVRRQNDAGLEPSQPTVREREGTSVRVPSSTTQAQTTDAAAPARPNWRTARRSVPERPADRRQ
jgi:hypothetical protein